VFDLTGSLIKLRMKRSICGQCSQNRNGKSFTKPRMS
jgi:hypothetical protein